MEITLTIEGMTCNGCKNSVERLLAGQSGVHKASVDLEAGCATVTADVDTVPQALAEIITNAGFEAQVAG